MSKFRNIPEPPYATRQEDLNWFQLVKYNLEILMGQRQNNEDAALMRSNVRLLRVPEPQLVRLKTGQQGVTAGGDVVPTLAEYEQLQRDVDTLRADVTVLRTYLNSLIIQLRGREE
jgi:hypothetical protein